MSEYLVGDWLHLAEALSAVENEDKLIKLTQSIEMNNEAPYGVSTDVYIGEGNTLIIDGQNFSIRNLRSKVTNPTPIFAVYSSGNAEAASFSIINCDFVNLICAGSHFMSNNTPTNPDVSVSLEKCRFVGYRTGQAFLINQQIRISVTSCFFDMPWYGPGSSEYDYCSLIPPYTDTYSESTICTADYCYFHETYGGWAFTNSQTLSNVRPATNTPTVQCGYFAMSGCYIDGSMKRPYYYSTYGTTGSIISSVEIYCYIYSPTIATYFSSSTPNTVDMHWWCDLKSGRGTSYQKWHVINMSGVIKRDASFDDSTSFSGVYHTAGSQPNVIIATPTQMEDIAWLQSHGFPVIDNQTTE